ncbi:DUF3632 domain-containing protein [Aspergillus mulundensis]|uniref:Uncharacterized protein n=1 Tax=Aspergillus mulundensis TaxID=1810919 RepID=A0A3D8QSB9_9EURO|nr:hypothetical protein DSM5745_09951 [Aspergillus mulundensis]RDW64540.1 hypothetical protein DSM5745_09951 [Aspergillus mulundensis]
MASSTAQSASSPCETEMHSPLQETADPDKVFVLCRPLSDDADTPAQWQISEDEAREMIKDAPMPSHNDPRAGRPHPHYDREGFFTEEMAGLAELSDAAPHNEKRAKLWAYPACRFDYTRSDGDPGPHRIITDQYKNILGVVSHPVGNKSKFVCAKVRLLAQSRTCLSLSPSAKTKTSPDGWISFMGRRKRPSPAKGGNPLGSEYHTPCISNVQGYGNDGLICEPVYFLSATMPLPNPIPKLHLQQPDESPSEEDYDNLMSNTWQVFKEYLENDDKLTLHKAALRLYNVIPDDERGSWAETHVMGVLHEVAEQIPYWHPGQKKLVRLVERLVDSGCLSERFRVEGTMPQTESLGEFREEARRRTDNSLVMDPRNWAKVKGLVNTCAFLGRLSAAGVLNCSDFMIWCMKDALERPDMPPERWNLYLSTSAVWILTGGHLFFHEVVLDRVPCNDRDQPAFKADGLYKGAIFGLDRWRFWQSRLAQLANDRTLNVTQEGSGLARKAAAYMAALADNVEW